MPNPKYLICVLAFLGLSQATMGSVLAAQKKKEAMLTGVVVAGNPPRPVPFAEVQPERFGHFRVKCDDKGRLAFPRRWANRAVCARSPDKKLAGIVYLEEDTKTVEIKMQPVGRAFGWLVEWNGLPVTDGKIKYSINIPQEDEKPGWATPFAMSFGGVVETDEKGRFVLPELIVGERYHLYVTRKGMVQLHIFRPESSEEVNLGGLLNPYHVYSYEKQVALRFGSRYSPLERFDIALSDAKISDQKVMVLFANPADALTIDFYKLRSADNELNDLTDSYNIVAIPTDAQNLATAKKLAERLHVSLPKSGNVQLCLYDSAGKQLALANLADMVKDGKIDPVPLRKLWKEHLPEILDARLLYKNALAQAKKENKRILVMSTATWCPACWPLKRYLHKQQKYLANDYIWLKIDRRWHNSKQLMREIAPKSSQGLPWMAILDADGKMLVNADSAIGNIGFPYDEYRINHFINMLRSTRQRMTDADLNAMRQALEKRE